MAADDRAAADELDLRAAVIGNGLALTRGAGDSLELHELSSGRARSLGTFASAAEAWPLIDALDLAEGEDIDLAA